MKIPKIFELPPPRLSFVGIRVPQRFVGTCNGTQRSNDLTSDGSSPVIAWRSSNLRSARLLCARKDCKDPSAKTSLSAKKRKEMSIPRDPITFGHPGLFLGNSAFDDGNRFPKKFVQKVLSSHLCFGEV